MNAVEKYIGTFPVEVQNKLQEMRRIIKETAPEAEEVIGYGIPTYKLNGNLVHFGGFKNHVGFYPTPSGIHAFSEALSKYKAAKGSLHFLYKDPLPTDLIKQIVKFRIEENLKK